LHELYNIFSGGRPYFLLIWRPLSSWRRHCL